MSQEEEDKNQKKMSRVVATPGVYASRETMRFSEFIFRRQKNSHYLYKCKNFNKL